jgi:3-deoxy-D-manno-octulosonate 8-phosphate phosphatase (KDO 8-P phosphatase)
MPNKSALARRLKPIKLLLLDVDGVMTDGGIYYAESGEELKKFNSQDGYGIVQLQRRGVKIGILTGRFSRTVEKRAHELGISEVYQNMENKAEAYSAIKARLEMSDREVAYIGDDEPDLPVLKLAGFSAAPANAIPAVRKAVDYVCTRAGGNGAVREVIDLILAGRK